MQVPCVLCVISNMYHTKQKAKFHSLNHVLMRKSNFEKCSSVSELCTEIVKIEYDIVVCELHMYIKNLNSELERLLKSV